MIAILIFLFLWASQNLALSDIQVAHGKFVHANTQREFRPLGFFYSTTNATDLSVDSLSDPQACLRDAALFQRLGINSIAVAYVSTELNHDECMSAFNSAGIYVVLAFDEFGGFWGADLGAAYSNRTLQRAFKLVRAFDRYENLLGFSLVNFDGFNKSQTPAQQPYLRAYVRDVKAYMAIHSPRTNIPVGVSRIVHGSTKATHMRYALDYARCTIPDDAQPSQLDFFGATVYDRTSTAQADPWDYYAPFAALPNQNIPLALNLWRQHDSFNGLGFGAPTNNFTALTDPVYRNTTVKWSVAGGLVHEWANVQYQKGTFGDAGIIELDEVGNVQMRPAYDSFAEAVGQLNINELRNGERLTSITTDTPCTATRSLVMETSTSGSAIVTKTITYNNTWILPTPPAGVASMIEAGVEGLQGTHVQLTALEVRQTVRDSSGAIITGLAIKPEPGTWTPPQTSEPQHSQGPPSGAKIGLAVAIPSCVALIGAVTYLLWRRRQRKNPKLDTHMLPSIKAELADSPSQIHEVHGLSRKSLPLDVEKQQAGAYDPRFCSELESPTEVHELPAMDVMLAERPLPPLPKG